MSPDDTAIRLSALEFIRSARDKYSDCIAWGVLLRGFDFRHQATQLTFEVLALIVAGDPSVEGHALRWPHCRLYQDRARTYPSRRHRQFSLSMPAQRRLRMDTVLPSPISQLHQLLTRLARTPVRYQLSLTTKRLANPRRDAVVRGETGDQTDQESRSEGLGAAGRVTAMDITTTTLGVNMTGSSTQGIKTVLHPVSDLATAKKVYAALLGVPPQTDGSYYVGFEAAGQQIGLVPGGGPQGMTSPVAYWHVSDIEAKLAEVIAAGATLKEPAHDVGGGRLVATVTDPDGNVLGLLQDP
jgi:predicted enzyme related to lactoylglutathione lyase